MNNVNTTDYPNPWGEAQDSQNMQLTVAQLQLILEAALNIISQQVGLSLFNNTTKIPF